MVSAIHGIFKCLHFTDQIWKKKNLVKWKQCMQQCIASEGAVLKKKQKHLIVLILIQNKIFNIQFLCAFFPEGTTQLVLQEQLYIKLEP